MPLLRDDDNNSDNACSSKRTQILTSTLIVTWKLRLVGKNTQKLSLVHLHDLEQVT